MANLDSRPEEKPSQEGESTPFVFRDNLLEVKVGAATLIGVGFNGGKGLIMELALLKEGDRQHVWKLQETDKALPLNRKLLAHVLDGEPLAMLPSFRARGNQGPLPDLGNINDDEALVFCEALYKANLTSTGAFANSARRDLTFADLFNTPAKYRGEVVHFEGLLYRIRRIDPPPNARIKGVDHLYEGWVFDPQRYGVNPVCLVFTELPAGLAVGEKMNCQVSFDAYFFKKYRYQSADSKPGWAREAPLFIGRSPVLSPEKQPTSDSLAWSTPLLVGFLGMVLATGFIAIGLHWWFRRGDRRIQDQLAKARQQGFVEPGNREVPDTKQSAH
jgi:hypothetical protein